MMDFEEEDRERMMEPARHEFGHFSVAKVLGFRAGAVTITTGQTVPGFAATAGTAEIILLKSINNISDVVDYCEKRIKVLMAGSIAEALENGAVANDLAIDFYKTRGASDFAKAREITHLLRGICNPETKGEAAAKTELQSISDRLWDETTNIVLEKSGFIEKMAQELASKTPGRDGISTFTEEELAQHQLVISTFGG